MTLGMEVGLSSGHTVLDRDPATLLQKGNRGPSQFSVHLSCGQMARWINMPLGAEVGLGPGHNVLDGDHAPPPKKGALNFRPMSFVAKRSPISVAAEHLF